MEHGVAIWAYRNKVLDRIQFVPLAGESHRPDVMHVNETAPERPIDVFE
jgi:hypothetical protein